MFDVRKGEPLVIGEMVEKKSKVYVRSMTPIEVNIPCGGNQNVFVPAEMRVLVTVDTEGERIDRVTTVVEWRDDLHGPEGFHRGRWHTTFVKGLTGQYDREDHESSMDVLALAIAPPTDPEES